MPMVGMLAVAQHEPAEPRLEAVVQRPRKVRAAAALPIRPRQAATQVVPLAQATAALQVASEPAVRLLAKAA